MLQTPYNSNKCVAPTNSQLSEEERGRRKISYDDSISPSPMLQPTNLFQVLPRVSSRQVIYILYNIDKFINKNRLITVEHY